uniref:CARD domain-containing protein n=1 Tax=Anabas testudineus TaxID=64144 RepID=A0A7N6AN62_ANATE
MFSVWLLSARTQFVHRVSETLLDQLLKTLLECRVITEDEVEEVAETEIRAVKAQMLIDTVRRKGSKASSALIAALWEEAPRLSTELKLIPGRHSGCQCNLLHTTQTSSVVFSF